MPLAVDVMVTVHRGEIFGADVHHMVVKDIENVYTR
jgi:hypothetical protein